MTRVEIDRKKMKKFLESLRVHSVEEIGERIRFVDVLTNANSEFQTVRASAMGAIYPRNTYTLRHDRLTSRSQMSLVKRQHGPVPTVPPKFVPASKYPLPMQPVSLVPKLPSKNPSRILHLSELRPSRLMRPTATTTTETDIIDSGRADGMATEISMGRVEETVAPVGRRSHFDED
jgi:hypothetical protein